MLSSSTPLPLFDNASQNGTIITFAGSGAYGWNLDCHSTSCNFVTGGYSGDGGPATSAQLNVPQGVFIDTSGNVYIVDTVNQMVRLVSASTGIITTLAGTGYFVLNSGPYGAGYPSGGYNGDDIAATSAQLNNPTDVIVGANGDFFVADGGNHRIRLVAKSTGLMTTYAGTGTAGCSGDDGPATSAQLNSPQKIAFDASGNLYIAANDAVRMVAKSTGFITTYVATVGSGGLAFESSGNLYFVDNGMIKVIDTLTRVVTLVAGTGQGGGCSGGGDGGPATSASFCQIRSIALDHADNVYAVDHANSAVRFIRRSTGIITTFAGTYSTP